ncbi:MAG: AMMECR1 domain-containing protein, partial [Myxococcales bacterium]|nr:AMMECR1 domain-containing protein [Myxococcales bacterium]
MVSLNGLEGMDLRILESVARRAIEQRIRGGASWSPDPAEFDDVYAVPGATFVTLRRHGSLRGCIGQLEPTTSVIESAARSAELAAL